MIFTSRNKNIRIFVETDQNLDKQKVLLVGFAKMILMKMTKKTLTTATKVANFWAGPIRKATDYEERQNSFP